MVQEAHPNYKEKIKEFEAKWEDLYISHDIWFTNKVHVIIDHVPQAIERTGKGLLGNSEQVVEATQAKFEKFWSKYVPLRSRLNTGWAEDGLNEPDGS